MIGLYSANSQAITVQPFSFGNALQFDGVDDNVSFTELNLSGAFTISYWVKYTSISNNILLTSGVSNSYVGFIVNSQYRLKTNTSNQTNHILPALSINTWYHYVVTRDSSYNSRVYVDTVESSSGAIVKTGTLTLSGISDFTTLEFQGDVDEIAIWNTLLSATDISNLYNSKNGDYATNYSPANLIAYWRMNGSGTDTTAIDELGTYNGTLNNFPASGMWVAH